MSDNVACVAVIITFILVVGGNVMFHKGTPSLAEAISHAIEETCHDL